MDDVHATARTPPPRTLLVADALFRTGATRVTLNLLRQWGAGASLLAVLDQPQGNSLFESPEGSPVVQLSRPGQRLRWTALASLVRLTRMARQHEVVVATSEIGPCIAFAWAAARLARRPFVVAIHADVDDALGEWVPAGLRQPLRWLHRHADAVICVDAGVVGPVLRNGLPVARVHVVRNGIDIAAVRAAASEGDDGAHLSSVVTADVAAPHHPVVVATGRLAPQKGYDLLLEAHAAVVGDHPHLLRVLNGGPEEASLLALADRLGVRASVEFAGAVPAPLPAVARADLFCLPSRHEGLPLALIEAVALGVPCLASDSSAGVRDVLADGRVGVLVPAGDAHALARALADHLADPVPLQTMALAGTAHADRFDVAAMADGWAAALRRVVEDWERRSRAEG